MSRDSDTALDGRAMDAIAKEKRSAAMAEALQHDDGNWTKYTPWHWQRTLGGKLLDYWPSARKWQWNGKIVRGTDRDLARFIERLGLPAVGVVPVTPNDGDTP